MASQLLSSEIPIITTVASYREWRGKAFQAGQSVGFVPTMGALHQGHLTLVKHSLANNDHTVVSIFVNPAQFAPNEDFITYPRTLPNDAALLASGQLQSHNVSVIFAPTAHEMYPSGITQYIASQKGTFVQVKGYDHQMEGKSRPDFFRGVATVVTKLFNIIQPTNAYFGQKDIQQALILRRLCRDLHFAHPGADHVHIIPTDRDPVDGLARSSRNVYLSAAERVYAPTLYDALRLAEQVWRQGRTKGDSVGEAMRLVQSRVEAARTRASEGVDMKLDYLDMNDAETLDELDELTTESCSGGVIISGALWVGKTRLIDNIVIGEK
ncbi:hypothetical protein APHAL10511_005228 [Amanita phalloides]|nr:hypothetical protein APHAL10511_005228 [Amanita phalloides]